MPCWLSRSWEENYIWTWKGGGANSAVQQLSSHLLQPVLTENTKKKQKTNFLGRNIGQRIYLHGSGGETRIKCVEYAVEIFLQVVNLCIYIQVCVYFCVCICAMMRRDKNKLCWVCTRGHSRYFPGCEHQINISPPSNIFPKDGNTNLKCGRCK